MERRKKCPARTLFRWNKRFYNNNVSRRTGEFQEGEKTMLYVMICRQHRHEQKRFWFCQERLFAMPVSEKQIMPKAEGIHADT